MISHAPLYERISAVLLYRFGAVAHAQVEPLMSHLHTKSQILLFFDVGRFCFSRQIQGRSQNLLKVLSELQEDKSKIVQAVIPGNIGSSEDEIWRYDLSVSQLARWRTPRAGREHYKSKWRTKSCELIKHGRRLAGYRKVRQGLEVSRMG